MKYTVAISRPAEKALDRMDRSLEHRMRERFRALAENPYDPRISDWMVERPGARKSRVGGWRILYTVDRGQLVIFIMTVDTRGQVYKHH